MEGGRQAISLPLSLTTLTTLVSIMYGGVEDNARIVQKEAANLGINIIISDESVKMEADSEQEEDKGVSNHIKNESSESKVFPKRSLQKKKADDISSEDDAEDEFVDEWDDMDGVVKDEVNENNSQEKASSKRTPKKINADRSWSEDESSDDEDSDPDYSEKTKSQNLTESPKKGRGRPPGRNAEKMRKLKAKSEFACDMEGCPERFRFKSVLMKHKLVKHNIDGAIHCEECGKVFAKLKELKDHHKSNHPKLTCEICGEKKITKAALKNHVEAEHTDGFPCPQCGSMFRTQVSLSYHLNTIHGDHEDLKCDKCDYKTRKADLLKGHIRRRHTEQLSETCEFCGEVFKGLKKHLERTGCGGAIQVNRVKVNCPYCPKELSDKERLRVHIRLVHDSASKNKVCPECSYSTYSNFNLKLHIGKMHGGPPVEKRECPFCQKVTLNLENHVQTYHSEQDTQGLSEGNNGWISLTSLYNKDGSS